MRERKWTNIAQCYKRDQAEGSHRHPRAKGSGHIKRPKDKLEEYLN